jgi:hypothetical protein
VVADGGEADLGAALASMRRSRRVSSCTPTCPMPGSVTERGRLLSPTRIAVDQIKPAPRHLRARVDFPLVESGFHHPQTLVERKSSRAGMPGQHLTLLDDRIEAELERGVSTHRSREHPITHRHQPAFSVPRRPASSPGGM